MYALESLLMEMGSWKKSLRISVYLRPSKIEVLSLCPWGNELGGDTVERLYYSHPGDWPFVAIIEVWP